MVSHSEKKAMKHYENTRALYLQIVSAITAVYVIVRIWLYSSSFTMGNWIGFAFLSLVNGLGLKLLFHYLSLGHPRSSYAMVEELLWVNWFVMAATVLSDWFWLVYLCVPAYAIYKFNEKTFRSMFLGEREPEAAPPTEEELRRQAKKEAKANRPRYIRG